MPRERLAHYRIERLLGAGGMGEVHAAFDEKLERRVAIKMLPAGKAGDDDARGRMLREARAASALHHPGIVAIYEIGEADGVTYIVMELVEGETFAERIARQGALPASEAVRLVDEVADALGVAHDAGILHRDIKSANLMIDRRGKVRVLDFGLSKRLGGPTSSVVLTTSSDHHERIDPDAPTEMGVSGGRVSGGTPDPVTAHGARLGTPGYAALELLQGRDADARSDVFSLGVVLYELVTGKRPFEATTYGQLEERMRAGSYEPASKLGADPRLDAVIAKALAAKRADRFASVAALVLALRAAVAVGRSRVAIYAALGGVAVLGAAAWFAVPRLRTGSAPRAIDAAPAPDAAPASPADLAAARPLTRLGGCASSPTFLDDQTVAFTLERGGPGDVYTVPLAGGEPRPLVASAAADWRPSPGRRADEVVYLEDPGDPSLAAVVVRALDGVERARIVAYSAGAAAIGDDLYYTADNGTKIRRSAGGRDEVLFTMPMDAGASTLTASPRGDRLGVDTKRPTRESQACVIVLGATPELTCVGPAAGGRVGFGVDDALYYAAGGAIRRFVVGGEPTLVLDAPARDLAIARDGSALVYSDCAPTSSIVAIDAAGSRVLLDEPGAYTPALGPAGAMVWGSRGAGLQLRDGAGTVVQLIDRSMGTVVYPSFSADGKHLVFGLAGDSPGIYEMPILGGAPEQITDGHDDEQPVYLSDGRVVFTRYDASGVAHAMLVSSTSTDPPAQLTPRSRYVLAANHATGEILLLGGALLWWNPVTGKERPGPKLPGKEIFQASISPSGTWLLVQTGSYGLSMWRTRLRADAKLEHVVDLPGDQTVSRAAIDDDGTIVAAPQVFRGELHVVPARAGARY